MDFKNFKDMDPYLLVSLINTRLRDANPSLSDFSKEHDIDEDELKCHLEKAGFNYIPSVNQFR